MASNLAIQFREKVQSFKFQVFIKTFLLNLIKKIAEKNIIYSVKKTRKFIGLFRPDICYFMKINWNQIKFILN